EVAVAAVATALHERRTVLLNLPLDVQVEPAPDRPAPDLPAAPPPASPDGADVQALAEALQQAERPVFIAGRGARSDRARTALEELADTCGALLATSAVAKGLFRDHPWSLHVSGGFASPSAADLIRGADLVVGWGAS